MLSRLLDNPILVKHLRSRLRRQHIIPLLVVELVICGCILWGGFSLNGFENGFTFSVFFAIQGVALLVVGTNQVVTSIGQVRESGILDFHRVSPLPAPDIAVGFLLGAPVREYLVALCVTPFALLAALQGSPGFLGYLNLLGVLLSSTLLFHALGLVGGVASNGHKRTGNGVTVLVIVAHAFSRPVLPGLALPGLLTVIPLFTEVMGYDRPGGAGAGLEPQFFGLDLPLTVQSLIYQLSLFVFLMIAVTRRMRNENAHLYSKTTAAAFLATVALLIMGGLVEHLRVRPDIVGTVLVYVIGSWAMILTLAVTPTAGEFANGVRRAQKHGKRSPAPWADLAANFWTVLVFCGIVLLALQLAYGLLGAEAPSPRLTIVVGSALATVAYFGFASQFFQLAFGRRANPYFLLFLFFVWLLPIMVGALIGISAPEFSQLVLSLSPIVGVGSGRLLSLVSSLILAMLCAILTLGASRKLATVVRAGTGKVLAAPAVKK